MANISFEQLKDLIAQSTGKSIDFIGMDYSLKTDLGLDSRAIAELLMSVQQTFNCTIPEAEAARILTVGDLYHYLRRLGT
jgi:acyl carrier protein